MNKNCVFYRGSWLAPGSDAYRLYKEGEMKKLDKHMKEVKKRYNEL